MVIHRLTDEEYESFLLKREFVVILFDAPWDVGPGALIRPRFERAAEVFNSRVDFGEVDTDEFVRIKSVPVLNVPTVAYYGSGQLVAALIGATQDVASRTRAMPNGMRIGRKDGWG